MPSYRGVDQVEIVLSIQESVSFLRKHSTGPELTGHLAEITQRNLADIATAQTDLDLVNAVRESGVEGRLCWIADLIRFHESRNTDGKGKDLAARLAAWDAFSGARAMVLTPLDVEIEAYIKKNRTPLSVLRETFSRGRQQERPGALQRYGLIIDDLTEKRVNWTDSAVQDIRKEAEKVLQPFFELNEVTMTGIGSPVFTPAEKKPMGVIFESTRRAAEAVAAAFPAYRVLDSKGNPVPPKSGPNANLAPKP